MGIEKVYLRTIFSATLAESQVDALAPNSDRIYNLFMSQSFHLFQLQKIDSQIDQIKTRTNEINAFLESDERLRIARALDDEKKELLRKSQLQLKRIEQDVAARRAKLEQEESNLYSGRIHIPKELQDIQSEVAALKRHISSLEDQQLEAMLVVEAYQADCDASQSALLKVEGEVASDQASYRGEVQRLQANSERLSIERNLLSGQISPDNLDLYNRLRKTRKGIAVASVSDESCSACGSSLTPAERQAARSPQNVVFCPSCGRIVYSG